MSHCSALRLISLIVKHDLLYLFPQVLWLLMGSVNHFYYSSGWEIRLIIFAVLSVGHM